MKYWPGTNVTKSSNNAFDWKSTAIGVMQEFYAKSHMSLAAKMNVQKRIEKGIANGEAFYMNPNEKPYQKQFTTYSKAVPSK